MKRTVIAGASVAGLAVAKGLRRAGYHGEVILIGEEPHLPYDRPPLSKQILSGEWDEDRLWMCSQSGLDDLDIDLRLGVRANSLDATAAQVALSNGEELRYSSLVIATGLRARIPSAWAAIDRVSVLRSLDDVRLVRSHLRNARDVVIVGAGFIGAEAAAAIKRQGNTVVMIDPLPRPLAGALPPELCSMLAETHQEHGVDVRCGVAVRDLITSKSRVRGVKLSDGSTAEADLVIVGLGATPNTDWLVGSGVPLDDGVICDCYNRACDQIYAAGDVASWINPRFGTRMRVEHRMHAADQAWHVARTIAGADDAEPFAPIPFFWSDQFDLRMQAFGHLDPADTFAVIKGSVEQRKLVATCSRDGLVAAVIGVNMPREARQAQALIGRAVE